MLNLQSSFVQTVVVLQLQPIFITKKYILVIVDDYTRFTRVFFLRLKSDTPQILINFIKEIELHIKLPVRRIKSDNGIEFTNQLLNSFLLSKGISHNFSEPYTQHQNGVGRGGIERWSKQLDQCLTLPTYLSTFGLKQWQPHVLFEIEVSFANA